MGKWIQLQVTEPGGPTTRCVVHGQDFRAPHSCSECNAEEPPTDAERAVGDLPYIPGLPTPIEDERQLRAMAARMWRKAMSSGGKSTGGNDANRFGVRAKYAELSLRALTAASAMAERRISDWIDEKRQAEALALKPSTARAKRK